MKLDILKSSDYCIIKDGQDYVFYNAARHYACRLSPLDLSIFNLIYKHRHIEIILKKISPEYHSYVTMVYNSVVENEVLSTNPIADCHQIAYDIPDTYYIHLTYSCNLDCVYCYNKTARTHTATLSVNDWTIILGKVAHCANSIIFTGGEPLLYKDLNEIIIKVKSLNPSVRVEMISNCMVDFETRKDIDSILSNLDAVVFSCDNISGINQPRKNFSLNNSYSPYRQRWIPLV